ncbi:hypothetical protein BN1058_00315 [Paraliobacillus sp. PM-2]|nr:hypothetical protein [Paraliobacillus sp. PM-2]CQR46070.1 hypothetical protein BN1058_00315 [Paraliobacillus sp. PM-2]
MRKWLVFLFLLLIITIGTLGLMKSGSTQGFEVEDNTTISID